MCKNMFEKDKAERIALILQSAQIEIHENDMFPFEIGHKNAMHLLKDARMEQLKTGNAKEAAEKVRDLELTKTISATMDFGHISPDWSYVLNRGIVGIIEDLERFKAQNKDKAAYYDNRKIVYEAMKQYCIRVAEEAEAKDSNEGRFAAKNLRQLTLTPPQTLAQAMQLSLLFYYLQTNLDCVLIRTLGGIDRMYYPFYRNDLESGQYTEDELKNITNKFLWKISTMGVTSNLPFYICGMDDEGNDATNEFTKILLEQYRLLDIYDPKIHVMYHDNIDETVLELVLEMIREGKNSFAFMNTPVISKSLESLGISEKDAKRVTVYGCYEPAAEGTEAPCTCGGSINLAKAVELAIYNGLDSMTGKQISIQTGEEFQGFEEFYDAVLKQMEHYTVACMNAIADYEKYYDEVCPSLIMSLTYKQSRESGVDVYSGGAKYNNTSIVGAGLATLTDSIVAVKQNVFENKKITFEELREILSSDWEQNPILRAETRNALQKFGNNNAEADDIAVDIYNRFADIINGRKNGRGGVFRCGMFSVDWRFWMGEQTGATPDGRQKGEAISKNLAAVIGQDKKGVTSYLNSVLKFDSEKVPDGYVADVVLHNSAVKGEDGMGAFKGLLLTFMKKGGFSVHFNILSPDVLIRAQREPEKYQNLQIRLCGWNVRFVDLSKEEQNEFIKQSQNGM